MKKGKPLTLISFILIISNSYNLTSSAQDASEEDLGQIVVSARALPELIKNSAHTIQVVTGKEIEERIDRSVAEALRELPGLVVETLGTRGESTNIRIRGGTNGDTLVLLDGVRLNNPFTNETNLSLIPVELIDRIEVLRGSHSVLYGGSAVAGVINIITKRGTDDNQFKTSAEGGNLFHIRGLQTWTGKNGPARYSLGISQTHDDGQFTNDEYDETAITQRWDFTPIENMELTVSSRFLISHKGLARGFLLAPGTLYDPDLTESDFFIQLAPDINRGFNNLLTTQSLSLTYDWNELTRTQFTYGFLLSTLEEKDSNQGNAPFPTPSGIGLAPNSVKNNIKSSRNSADIRQFFFLPELSNIRQSITAGFEFYDERVETSGESPFPGDAPPPPGTVGPILPPVSTIPSPEIPGSRQNYAPFLQYHLEFSDRFIFDAGARWDINSAYGNELSPRVAVAVLIPEIDGKFHASYGEGFLPPTFLQLAVPPFGNPDLAPQTSQSYDVGYQQFFGNLANFYVTYWYLDFDNLINRLGQNIDDAFSTGIESGFFIRPIKQLSFGANYTYTHSRDESSGTNNRLPNIPNHVFNAFLTAHPWRSLEIATTFNFVSDQFAPFPTISTDGRFVGGTPAASLNGGTNGGYTRWDLAVHYTFDLENPNQNHPKQIKVYGKFNNLLNNQYEENFGFPVPGFTTIIGAEMNY